MFGFVADAITVTTTVFLPVFISYKALHTSDPAVLAPWLIYFVTLTLLTTLENTFSFILDWVPFYSWIRLCLHGYLILPGSQGATFVYREYLEPFLYHHEREIDNLITDVHDRARQSGLRYVGMLVEWVKVNVMGFQPRRESPPPSRQASYAQSLMSRFNMPAARGTSDLAGLVSQALGGASALYNAGAGSHDAGQAEGMRGPLIPESIRDNDEKLSYLASQRQRLTVLMQAFDREQDQLMGQQGRDDGRRRSSAGLSRNKSESEFDRIDPDEVEHSNIPNPPYPMTPPALDRRTSSGSWMPWNWQRAVRPTEPDHLAYGEEPSQGRASGYDRGR
ncbi:hypothetical protein GQ43DRAFT_406409 [Delitschia confertaspora ATCC 74209]|uniref:Protein YOP1 n=1 Tax=Delitschia confertaspora ATCC 74209 TaxID=1513339 RepID=A0A9P4K0Q1_9PLEO|nr:hypothetical protein GQ43DRAFT_406409 [Delitschia confertaspora ATCC 74209]